MISTPEAKTPVSAVNREALDVKVKEMYRLVALSPHGDFHFEMGRQLAERLGYAPEDLDRIPAEAVESFAGVGCYFHLADLKKGERVLDLGSGSGMDSFIAALKVGSSGAVIGVDMTEEQRSKAEQLRQRVEFDNVTFLKGRIESLPCEDAAFDAVISNGVINLSADKPRVFAEAARVLRPGGRLALSDIVTEVPLPEGVVCNATLWAACIGGAMQQDDYCAAIERAGFKDLRREDNASYQFLTHNAQEASRKFGVKSVSLIAIKQ